MQCRFQNPSAMLCQLFFNITLAFTKFTYSSEEFQRVLKAFPLSRYAGSPNDPNMSMAAAAKPKNRCEVALALSLVGKG